MTIGERAFLAIHEKAKQERITFTEECENIGISRVTPRYWKRAKNGMSSAILAEMYYLGYDVIWILTGERKQNAED